MYLVVDENELEFHFHFFFALCCIANVCAMCVCACVQGNQKQTLELCGNWKCSSIVVTNYRRRSHTLPAATGKWHTHTQHATHEIDKSRLNPHSFRANECRAAARSNPKTFQIGCYALALLCSWNWRIISFPYVRRMDHTSFEFFILFSRVSAFFFMSASESQ